MPKKTAEDEVDTPTTQMVPSPLFGGIFLRGPFLKLVGGCAQKQKEEGIWKNDTAHAYASIKNQVPYGTIRHWSMENMTKTCGSIFVTVGEPCPNNKNGVITYGNMVLLFSKKRLSPDPST